MGNNQAWPNPGIHAAPAVALSALYRATSGGGGSGGGGSFSWEAPDGLNDLSELIVSTDGSEGWDFGAGPTAVNALGFGVGFVIAANAGQYMDQASYVDPLSGNAWGYEKYLTPYRYVHVENGVPFLRANLNVGGVNVPPNGGGPAGILQWDVGAPLPENTKVFQHAIERLTWGTTQPVDPPNTPDPQWKSMRIRSQPWLSLDSGKSYHDAYTIYWHEATSSEAHKSTISNYTGTGAVRAWRDAHATYADDGWNRREFLTNCGTVGNADGWLQVIKQNFSTGVEETGPLIDANNSQIVTNQVQLLHPESAYRWRYIQREDYIKNQQDSILDIAEWYAQYGSWARFHLADGPTPETSTKRVLLVPKLPWSPGQVRLHLYKSLLGSYAGKYIHFTDDADTFRGALQLTP